MLISAFFLKKKKNMGLLEQQEETEPEQNIEVFFVKNTDEVVIN